MASRLAARLTRDPIPGRTGRAAQAIAARCRPRLWKASGYTVCSRCLALSLIFSNPDQSGVAALAFDQRLHFQAGPVHAYFTIDQKIIGCDRCIAGLQGKRLARDRKSTRL